MRNLLLTTALLFASHSFAHVNSIYGDDDRYEPSEFPQLEEQIRSVAVMVETALLAKTGSDFTYKHVSLKERQNLCPGERFEDQPTLGLCTGSLIAPDVILTAAHCVELETDCSESSWVFDYQVDALNRAPNKLATKNVFRCQKVIHSSFYPSMEIDFALVKLDREVVGRVPLKIAPYTGKLPFEKEILMMGFPSGLPMKVATNAQVMLSGISNFKTNLDAFGGNSGSPVFDKDTMEILGILISGSGDYQDKGACRVPAVRPQMSIRETATNTKFILEAMAEKL